METVSVSQIEMSGEREPSYSQYEVGEIRDSVGVAIGPGASVSVHRTASDAEQAREQENREQGKLAQAVKRMQESLHILVSMPPAMAGSPYKNLLPYDLPDAAYFFGREREINLLCDELTCCDLRCHLFVLHGEAGIGKTSLVRAGLAPRLIAEGHLPLLVRVGRGSLVDAIKGTLLPDLSATPNFRRAPLREFLRQVGDLLPAGKRVCVLLDQFEAFFEQPEELRQPFLDQLAECLLDEEPRDSWLVAIQSSRLSRLSYFQPAIPQPLANLLEVPPLSCEQARKAILQPASLGGFELEDGLLEALLNDLGGDAIDPSSLQMVCHTLVEGLPHGEKRLALADYERAGLARGILRRYLDITLERHLVPGDREAAWRLLAGLIQNRSGGAALHELAAHMKAYGMNPVETQLILDLLERDRLVRWSGERYILAHPDFRARIKEWADRQAGVEQARLEAIRQMERVRDSALRGLLGGALGMVLAYLLTYSPQIYADTRPVLGRSIFLEVLILLAVLQVLPGAFAGLLLTLLADIAQASYHGPRRRLRWLVVGLAGAAAYSVALVTLAFLNKKLTFLDGLPVAVEGGLWGLAAGLGTVWAMSSRRPAWQTLPAVALACGLTLWLADGFGRAFESPPYPWLVGLAGAAMPLLVITSTLMGRNAKPEEI